MRIIDDVLPAEDFTRLQKIVLAPDFPWYFARKTRDDDVVTNPYLHGWVHYVYPQRLGRSDLLDTLPVMLHEMFLRLDEPAQWINRMRIVMNTTAPEPWLNGVHADFGRPHRTALLYLNDADGDTVIYRETWTEDHPRDPSALNVLGTVSPKPNRLVIFDGMHLHTGTLPVKANRRVVLNINYMG